MGYKFGQNENKIVIEIEGREYGVKLNSETTEILETFGARAIEVSKKEDPNFEEFEDILIGFVESIIGVEETNELLESIDEENKNVFEYMALVKYIQDEIKTQSEKLTEKLQNARAGAPIPVRRRR